MSDRKTALITGSSDGIGAAIAKYLGANGYDIVVTYNAHQKEADEVVAEIKSKGNEAIALPLEVTNEGSVKSCFLKVEEKFGKLDVLVNNAGYDALSPIESCTLETWKKIIGPKIDGNFLCTKYALPLLKKPGKADVIVIMSNLGEKVDPEDPAYCVGTAGAVTFVRCMAFGLAKYGIRTNGVGPGSIKTNLDVWKDLGLDKDEPWKEMAQKNPLGRNATIEDVAKTVLDVVENSSQFWNGNFVFVTGGEHLSHL